MPTMFKMVFFTLSCATVITQAQAKPKATAQQGPTMTTHVSGAFTVKLVPQKDDTISSAGIGRMSINKQFHGDLEASSQGQMLAAGTEVKDSAGYVALEKVSGALRGRKGTFVLQHSGTMTRGVGQLMVTVVPDSGTGELKGLTGKMTIDIRDGQHFYGFDYTLTPAP